MPFPTLPSNAALVAAARGGDHAAWETLFDRFDGLLLTIARAHRLPEPDIDDIRQTTWLRAVESLDRLRQPSRVGAWLATIARNECLRLLGDAKRVVPVGDDVATWHDDRAAPEARLLQTERCSAVRGALRSLGVRDRTLLALLYSDRTRSYTDIGQALRMPVGSIGPTRGRVLERLRRQDAVVALAAAA